MMEQGTPSRACHLPVWPEAWGLATEGVDMTDDRRSKRAIRSRMAQTGEKYTEARRALLASGGDSGDAGEDPDVTIAWSEGSLAWFSGQAVSAILLAEDEARMLSHARVEPEHLLLAVARRGNVQSLLLTRADIDARAIHELILRMKGFGEKLELRPRRSPSSEEVLRRAVVAAVVRGVTGLSTEHLLIALGEQELPSQILWELAVTDVEALVDARYPVDRPPLAGIDIQRRASRLAASRMAPSRVPIPPIFERFTSQARDAINAGIDCARRRDDWDDWYVETDHLLLGVLNADSGVAATVRTRYDWQIPPPVQPVPVDVEQPEATDKFSSDARRIVAEDVLMVAERLDHRALTTGHLLIALLESRDERISEIISSLPDVREITAAVIDALPGEEDT